MEERELLEAYESEKDALKAWGGFVLTSICEELGRMLPSDFKLDDLLKVPPCCRVKSDASLVAKAFFRRRKVYTNPLQEITDKIGVRFVVLLESETSLVEKALRNVNAWTFEKDRDYEQERSERPEIFTYQSVHYVVYSNSRMSQDGVEIPYRFPCEVQIRTLLQHAYSEFSHRYYYKNTTQSGDLGRRLLARSCALIEVTDGFFSQASESIRAFADKAERLLQEASRLYTEVYPAEQEPKLTAQIADSLSPVYDELTVEQLRSIAEQRSIRESLRAHREEGLLFRLPVVLILYAAVHVDRHKVRQLGIISERHLRSIFNDLGYALDE